MTLPRRINENDIAILSRFAQLLDAPDQDAFLAQLRHATVTRESPGHTSYAVPSDAPPIRDKGKYALAGSYRDEDGALVDMIVHIAFPEGVLSWSEQYRTDGGPLQRTRPAPNEITLEKPFSSS